MDPEEQFAASLLGFLSGARASSRPRRSTGPQRKPRIAIEKMKTNRSQRIKIYRNAKPTLKQSYEDIRQIIKIVWECLLDTSQR